MTEVGQDRKSIIVAIQPDSLGAKLLKSALGLAKAGGFRVRAIHVLQPLPSMADSYAYLDMGAIATLSRSVHEDQIQEAEQALTAMIEDLDPEHRFIEKKVFSGIPSDVICEEATKGSCAFIITGASPGTHRYIPRGISTALSLMGQAPVPVIVVREGVEFSWPKDHIKIFVGDDLRKGSEELVAESFALARMFGSAKSVTIQHCHVLGFDLVDLEFELAGFKKRLPDTVRSSRPVGEIYNFLVERVGSALKASAEKAMQSGCPQNVHYVSKVLSGSPLELLDATIQEFAPQIVLLGRHRALHKHPWGIGKVPLHGSLAFPAPVMIVPVGK